MAEPVKAIPLSAGLNIGAAPHRCAGVLAPAALGNSQTKFERFFVQGGDILKIVWKFSVVGGTTSVTIYGLLSDANGNDNTTGTRDADNKQANAAVTTTQDSLSYTVTGERYCDVEVITDGSGATLTYLDVLLKP